MITIRICGANMNIFIICIVVAFPFIHTACYRKPNNTDEKSKAEWSRRNITGKNEKFFRALASSASNYKNITTWITSFTDPLSDVSLLHDEVEVLNEVADPAIRNKLEKKMKEQKLVHAAQLVSKGWVHFLRGFFKYKYHQTLKNIGSFIHLMTGYLNEPSSYIVLCSHFSPHWLPHLPLL